MIKNILRSLILIQLFFVCSTYSQELPAPKLSGKTILNSISEVGENKSFFQDTTKKKLVTSKSISAIFISFGGGIAVPLGKFKENSDVTFGVLGRLEFASTSIYPFIIGAQVDYFSYSGADEFKTINLLSNFRTKILAFGLNIEYPLSKLFRSSFTMPFLTIDVKSNRIKREYDESRNLDGLLREEQKISVGAGVGMTLFILDFLLKYNYMKDNSFIGVYTKTKIPVIKF